MQRKDGTVGFYRPWNVYKKGFGDYHGEFWLGLSDVSSQSNFRPNDCLANITRSIDTRRSIAYLYLVVYLCSFVCCDVCSRFRLLATLRENININVYVYVYLYV